MSKIIRKKLNQYGFSLVEIMVVVAIVGILTVVAIPQYQKYQRRALQGEAKMLLSNLYTIERTFSINWGYGATNLPQMGFKTSGNVAYNAGWNSNKKFPGGCNTNQKQSAITCAGYQGPGIPKKCGAISSDIDKLVNTHFLCPPSSSSCDCTHTETSPISDKIPSAADTKVDNTKFRGVQFTIGASRRFGNGKQDVWTINHNKRLKNIESGI